MGILGPVDLATLSPAMLSALRATVGEVARAKIDAELAARDAAAAGAAQAVAAVTALREPVTFTVPFGILVSDNERGGVMSDRQKAQRRRWVEALARFQALARDAHSGPPVAGPCRVIVTLYFPDRIPRDACNFWKLLGDGLKGTVLRDDRWENLREATILAVGIDPERPRAEVRVEAWAAG